MYLAKEFKQYNNNYIFFHEPIKNNIMNEGNFIRIIYSSPDVVLNGIYILFTLNDVTGEKYYNKYKCCFDVNNHLSIINNMKLLEESILNKYNTNKIPSYKISQQLKNGHIKLFTELENNKSYTFVLKISGIWETNINYGLTYKFITINSEPYNVVKPSVE